MFQEGSVNSRITAIFVAFAVAALMQLVVGGVFISYYTTFESSLALPYIRLLQTFYIIAILLCISSSVGIIAGMCGKSAYIFAHVLLLIVLQCLECGVAVIAIFAYYKLFSKSDFTNDDILTAPCLQLALIDIALFCYQIYFQNAALNLVMSAVEFSKQLTMLNRIKCLSGSKRVVQNTLTSESLTPHRSSNHNMSITV